MSLKVSYCRLCEAFHTENEPCLPRTQGPSSRGPHQPAMSTPNPVSAAATKAAHKTVLNIEVASRALGGPRFYFEECVDEQAQVIQSAIDEATGPLVEALRGLLKSSDCAWFHSNDGHDWRDAVITAERALREALAARTKGGME